MNLNIGLSKLRLFREVNEEILHQLSFGVYKNIIRLYVREVNKKDPSKGKLVFTTSLMPINARVFGEMLEELPSITEKKNKTMMLYGPKWENNKRVDGEKVLIAKIGVAKAKDKEDNLINLVLIITPEDVKYLFPLTPTPYVQIIEDGEIVKDKSKLSNIWAKAYSKTFNDILALIPEAYELTGINSEVVDTTKKTDKEEVVEETTTSDIDDLF